MVATLVDKLARTHTPSGNFVSTLERRAIANAATAYPISSLVYLLGSEEDLE